MYGPSGMWAAALRPSACTPRGLAVMIMAIGLDGVRTAICPANAWWPDPSPRAVETLAE